MNERLQDAHVQEFLASKEVVVLATLQADGSPLAMPVWFLHGRDALTMISLADTQKVRNLRRDSRVCVVAESGSRADARSVIIEGRAEFIPESRERHELARALLEKYSPDLGRRWGGGEMPQDRVMFRVVPNRVRSWGLG
jgi:PPOX class probable F420-dependent enzyme